MTVHFKSFVFLMVGACGLIAALAWAGVRAISQHGEQTYEGYFAPVYSPDGQYVYFIERRSNGVVKQTSRPSLFLDGGPKFAVSVAKDAFSLKRLHVQSGQVEELTALSPSPIEGRNYEAIGSPFHSPDARLSYKKDGQLEFKVCLTVHQVPLARNYSSIGVWSESRHAAEISQSWKETHCETGGYNEWPISGDWELTAVRGEVGFSPAAIVAFNHVTGEVKALVKNKDYDRLYPKGFSLQELQKYSQRAAIERLQAMLRTHEELLQKYKAMGMSEVPALLQTGRAGRAR